MALVTPAGGQCTYGEAAEPPPCTLCRIAALELPPGSRVGILGPNSLFWVAAYLAVMKLGHVVVPFSDEAHSGRYPPQRRVLSAWSTAG